MLERETGQADAVRPVPSEARPGAAGPGEPATARALWPTFMRRTLSEEALRHDPPPPAGK